MSRTVILLAASLIFPRTSFCGEDYRIEPGQSAVNFSVRHMVLTTVHGKFTDFSGILELEDNDLSKSSVSVRINAASITTENAARDKDLRSANFLDAEKYPEITFVSHRVVKQNDGYLIVGDLNMHGLSREVSIPFTFNGRVKDLTGKMRVGFEGHVTINRKDWGINYSKLADNGGLVAANEVTIELDIEAMSMPAKSGDHIDQK
ncbi:MAG TPA: YceI family protein [Blastocatellia bacterium]